MNNVFSYCTSATVALMLLLSPAVAYSESGEVQIIDEQKASVDPVSPSTVQGSARILNDGERAQYVAEIATKKEILNEKEASITEDLRMEIAKLAGASIAEVAATTVAYKENNKEKYIEIENLRELVSKKEKLLINDFLAMNGMISDNTIDNIKKVKNSNIPEKVSEKIDNEIYLDELNTVNPIE